MKKISIIGCLLFVVVSAFAQPGWVKNASRSVFTLKTFAADGSLIASSNGFFTGTNGEAVSNFAPFKGAVRAVVIDAQGKEFQVAGIMGANDMYDVVKFRVGNTKPQPLATSSSISSVGSVAYLLPYHEVKAVKSGAVRKAETFQGNFPYYTVALSMGENQVGCPLLNASGQVIGMMQQPAVLGDSLSYAVIASFADSLKITGLTFNDETLRLTQVKKLLPTDIKEASLVLYFAGSQVDSAQYVSLIHDFIQQFPNAPEGYMYRAQQETVAGDFSSAERDMEQALKFANPKDDVYFNYARMIYNKEIFQSAQPYAGWSLEKALQQIQAANAINPQPAYRQLEANIRFAMKQYQEAYDIYQELLATNLRSAEVFFAAARCKEMQKDSTAMLALMDSTISMFTRPYLKEVAPYLWARAEARRNAGLYRDAVSDMNEYETLMTATVNDNFYYIRHQVEIQGRLYQQALNDINRAIQMNPNEILYYAEKASLEIRVGLYDQAITTAKECIALDASNSDGHLFLGLAQCLKGQKKEGIENLRKAKELGDTQADGLIEKYK